MSWVGGNSGDNLVCIPCRFTAKRRDWGVGVKPYECPHCGEPFRNMGTKWRPPKKNNEIAWKLIAQGNIWWDKGAVEQREAKKHRQIDKVAQRMRMAKHIKSMYDSNRH